MGKVGIADVAVAAEVSLATVSRVVNNRGLVAPATRQRVEDAMRRLGYSKASQANVVALVVPGLDDPFFARLGQRLSASLGLVGLRGVVCSAPSGQAQEFEFIAALADLGMVGAVFVSASNTLDGADLSSPRLLASRSIPFVCVNGSFAGVASPTLSSNDELAAELSVEHLWDLGHRRIGLMAGPSGNRPSDRRVRGFQAAMRKRGAPLALVARQHYSIEGGYLAASEMLKQQVTAIIAASDDMALGAIRAARWHGLSIPDQLSLVGYDDAYPAEFIDPPLTTVRQPIDRLAHTVVSVLTRSLHGGHVDAGELLFDPELIIRSSTASAIESDTGS